MMTSGAENEDTPAETTETAETAEAADAADTAGAADPPRRKGRKRRRAAIGLLSLVLIAGLALAGFIGLLALRSEPFALPAWAERQLGEQLNRALAPYSAELGGTSLLIEEGWRPRVLLADAELMDASGARIVSFDALSVGIAMRPLFQGALRPTDVSLSGTRLGLRRDKEGAFWLSLGEALATDEDEARGFAEIMAQIDGALARPELSQLEKVAIGDVTLSYSDERARRSWTVDGGRVELDTEGGDLRARADFALLTGGATAAGVDVTFERRRGAGVAALGLQLSDFPARDLATQSAALSWLEALKAPISGALRLSMDDTGALGPLSATLQIAKGVLQPNDAATPIPFDTARTYLTYDPAEQIIRFDEINLQSEWVSLRATGKLGLLLSETSDWPEAFVGQLALENISANPTDLLAEPVSFERGAADLKLSLAPFRVELGQLSLAQGETQFQLEGSFDALDTGWSYQVQAAAADLGLDQVLSLWPEAVDAKTRVWVARNVLEGRISEAQMALRAGPDIKPEPFISFGFEDVKMRFLDTMPPIEALSGQATVLRKRFAARASKGFITAAQGGRLNVAGTEFIIPRTQPRPARAQVNLKASGQVTGLLSLAASEPVNALRGTGLPVTLADGRGDVAGRISWIMKPPVDPDKLQYEISANLSDVRSSVVVPGRVLASPKVSVNVTPERLVLKGAGRLDTIPVSGTLTAQLGEGSPPATVDGTIELSNEFVRSFRLGLPTGSVTGRGTGNIKLTLEKGGPRFSLTSNLAGLGLAIPQIGWRHAQRSRGALSVSGRLGQNLKIDRVSLEASGLKASGDIALGEGGTFQSARFGRVTIGNWLNVPLRIASRGQGRAPRIEISGGRLDLSQTTLGEGGSGGGQGGGPIVARLDELKISSGISLRSFRGEFSTAKGFEGNFTGSVNGRAPVTGRVVPQGGRSAFRIISQNGGQVLAAAGLLENASGGTLDLTMAPASAKGTYNGALDMKNVRLKDAPSMAALLSAASIIGLLEQLGGNGIPFTEVEARFQLTPNRVILSKASAIGASMGISMDGFYTLGSGAMDMQGVVSPFFLVNGIGSIFTRKGEGLVGFNYNLRGTATDPKVQINPLSIFTPGMFREIFRRPPPKVQR